MVSSSWLRVLGVLVLVGTCAFGAASRASASLVLALDLSTLVARASHVVVARVESQRARYDARGRIVTDVTLRVDESLVGPARVGERVVLERFGGAIGELGMRVEGEPLFADGTRVLVFAAPAASSGAGRLRPVGMAQGVMRVEPPTVPGGEDRVLPGGEGLALVRPERGRLVTSEPAIAAPRPLGAVRDAIVRLRGVRRAP
jgi:hypothetical protein